MNFFKKIPSVLAIVFGALGGVGAAIFSAVGLSLIALIIIISAKDSVNISGPPKEKPTINAAYALYFKLPFTMSINVEKMIPQEYADVAIFDEKGNKKLMTAKEFDALLRSAFNKKSYAAGFSDEDLRNMSLFLPEDRGNDYPPTK